MTATARSPRQGSQPTNADDADLTTARSLLEQGLYVPSMTVDDIASWVRSVEKFLDGSLTEGPASPSSDSTKGESSGSSEPSTLEQDIEAVSSALIAWDQGAPPMLGVHRHWNRIVEALAARAASAQAVAPGLDVERLLYAANRVGEDSGDLIHWDVDQQWWELPQGPEAFIRAVAAAYAEADR